MRNKFKLPIFLFVFFISLYSNAQSFQNLASTTKYGNIKYKAENTVLINKEDINEERYELIKTKINAQKNIYYKIYFDYGESEDPNYTICKINSDGIETEIANIDKDFLIIPGNGYIYAGGSSNEYYDRRIKYKLAGDKLVEVPQAAYYVGMASKTNSLITLYADKNKSDKVAVLPQNYKVEILIEDKGWLLLKTPFGLTGWLKISDIDTYMNPTLDGFRFNGD